jgi:hypothetical protein
MDTDNSNLTKTTHFKLDAETQRLWEIYLQAQRDCENLSLTSSYLNCLSGRFDDYMDKFVLPVSAELRCLIQRANDLTDEWYEHDAIVDQSLQEVAWRFVAHAFGLHRGDLVRRQKRILSPDDLFAVDETVGNLCLRGRILTKSGSPGRRELQFSLLHEEWSRVAPGTASDPPQA